MAEVLNDNKHIDNGVENSDNNNVTPDQENAVKRILELGKDYYKILDVPKDASDECLKKAFRNLALKIHPDKNNADGATEAFKKLNNAYEVLSKPDKRRDFDLNGPDNGNIRRKRYDPDFSDTDSDEEYMSFNEIFERFFGGSGCGPFCDCREDGYWWSRGFSSGSGYSSKYQSQSYGYSQRFSSESYSQSYSSKYEKPPYTSEFETKDKDKRQKNVKSVFTTKGSREDDYDIDMVLRNLGETNVNPSKKKSQKK